MKTLHFLIAAVLAALVFSPPALAQGAPGPRLNPAEMKRGWYEDRRIYVEVMTDSAFDPVQEGLRPGAPATFPFGEHFGIRIGNVVPLRLRIYVLHPDNPDQSAIKVNFANLKAGRLSIEAQNDPDFQLADPSVLPEGELPISVPDKAKEVVLKIGDFEHPADLWEIRMYAQTMRNPQPMLFALQFRYAARIIQPGGSLDWQTITTPEYVLSMSRTADDGTDLSTGNTSLQDQTPRRPLAFILMAIGMVLALAPLSLAAIRYARKRLAGRIAPDPEEALWGELKPLLKARKTNAGYSFNEADVRQIVQLLLEYAGYPTLTSSELEGLKYEDDDGGLLHDILWPLMRGVLEEGEELTEERYAKIVRQIRRFVPEP